MKKNLIASYVDGITDLSHGEKYSKIFKLFFPEFISALLLYSLPILVDEYFIGQLQSTPAYATLGMANSLIHLIMKLAEGFSVGTVILSGYYNGREAFTDVGNTLRDAFWVSIIVGTSIATLLYIGAPFFYSWYVPAELVPLGVPFVRIRALGVFFMFIFLAFVGFLRGIKNTQVPMQAFIIGSIVFLICDYTLIFGHFGFPALGLTGSAIASVVQYVVMALFLMCYVRLNPTYKEYRIRLFNGLREHTQWRRLIRLSLPVVLDKATLATAYVWLGAMFQPLGQYVVATFCVIKSMERFAFLPAIACAQVVTLLVSNDYAQKNWVGIKSNIKKAIFLSSCFMFCILVLLSVYPEIVVELFDKKREFGPLAARVFPLVSVLVFFDLLQLILSAALRGASNVRMVMLVRLIVCVCFFVPVSYFCSRLPIESEAVKFCLIYSTFYISNGIMSLTYIWRFRGERWQKKAAT